MPIFADEQEKRRVISAKGLNPDQYDFDEQQMAFVPRVTPLASTPSTDTETTVNLPKPASVKPAVSLGESVGRSAAEAAIPTAASLGTIAGLSWLAGPEVGIPASIAMLLAGAGAGAGAGALQKAVVPEEAQKALFTTPESREAHPYGTIAGGFIPSALAFNPARGIQDLPTLGSGLSKIPQVLGPVGRTALTSAEEAALFNAAANTLPQAAISGYHAATSPEPFNLGHFAAETLPGLLFTRPTGIGRWLGFHEPVSPEALAEAFPRQPTTGRPAEVPRTPTTEELLTAGGAPFERTLPPREGKLTEAGVAALEKKQYGLPGLKHRDEPKLHEEALATLEGEGGPPPKPEPEAPPKDLIEELARHREEMEYNVALAEAQNKKLQERLDDLEKRQSEEADLRTATQTELNTLDPQQQRDLNLHLKDLARRRGFKIKEEEAITTPEGKSIAGQIDLPSRTIRLSKLKSGPETATHEGAGHGFLNDLLRSSSKSDQKLGIKALNAYAGKYDKKFTTPEEWFAFTKTNPEEAYRTQKSIEETLAKETALEGVSQAQRGLYGGKGERLAGWLKEAKSRWKTEFGLGTPEDIRSHLVSRYRGDAPYGTRLELSPLNRKAVTNNAQDQKEGEEVLTPNTRESIGAEAGETPTPSSKPEVARLAPKGSGRNNPLGDPIGTTYHATPEDWGKWQGLVKRPLTEEGVWPERERIKNKYGGMPPEAPKGETRNSVDPELIQKKMQEQYGESSFRAAKEAEKAQRESGTLNLFQQSQLRRIRKEIEGNLLDGGFQDFEARDIAQSFTERGKDLSGQIEKQIGEEKLVELQEEIFKIKHGSDEDIIDKERNLREKFDKANFKAEEAEANERPDTERNSEEPQLNTPEFKKWFGDSKVVDKDGKPLVVYHGTDKDFTIFKHAKEGTLGSGIYLTPHAETASMYSFNSANAEKRNTGSNVKPLFASIKNPLEIKAFDIKEPGRNVLEKLGYSPEKARAIVEKAMEAKGNLTGELQTKVRNAGYDGIITRDKQGYAQEIVVFRPEQIKSAIGNSGEFNPNNPDIRYSEDSQLQASRQDDESKYPSSYSFNRLLTSRLDKVAEKIDKPIAKEVTYKLRQANTERDILEGRVGNKLIAQTKGYTPREIENVYEYRHAIDNGFEEPFDLTSREEGLKEKLDAVYKDIGQMVIDSGLKVRSGDLFRAMKLKDEGYQQNTLAPKVAEAWAESKPEATEYDRLFLEHAERRGVSPEEAQQVLDDYKEAIGNAGITPDVKFAAIRKAEGIGLPWSLVEHNFNAAASRYGRRVAGDLSFFKYIQNDPRMQKALGIKDQFGNKPDPKEVEGVEHIGSSPEVKAAMRSIYGIDVPPNPVAQSLARVVGANIMETGTAIRNLFQLPTSVAPYYGVNLGSSFRALTGMNSRVQRAFENNAIKSSFKDFDAAGDFEGNPNKFIRMADKYVSFMRKWTGRDLSDKTEGLFTYSLGEELATKWFALAKTGDKEARRMLERFGTTVEGGVKEKWMEDGAEITQDDVSRVAKEFVDVARGSYSAAGIPSAAIEGPMAPFLALSRWGIERSNNFWKDAILPAKEGNFAPLLKTSFAALLTGAAIEKLNEALSNRKASEPTIKEAYLSGKKEDLIAKAISLAQLGALGGIVSDALKFGSNIAQGKETKFSSPISYPLASVAEDLAKKTSFAVQAIQEGEDFFEVMGEYMKEIIKTQSQNARYVNNHLNSEETARKENFRDLRVFKELNSGKAPEAGESNPFRNLKAKTFKKETDVEKAANSLPGIIDKIVAESNGDYEKLKQGLEGLKANSYQIFPSPETRPIEAGEFYDFLVKTQGKAEADRRLQEFLEMRAKNKIKSSLVPTLK